MTFSEDAITDCKITSSTLSFSVKAVQEAVADCIAQAKA